MQLTGFACSYSCFARPLTHLLWNTISSSVRNRRGLTPSASSKQCGVLETSLVTHCFGRMDVPSGIHFHPYSTFSNHLSPHLLRHFLAPLRCSANSLTSLPPHPLRHFLVPAPSKLRLQRFPTHCPSLGALRKKQSLLQHRFSPLSSYLAFCTSSGVPTVCRER